MFAIHLSVLSQLRKPQLAIPRAETWLSLHDNMSVWNRKIDANLICRPFLVVAVRNSQVNMAANNPSIKIIELASCGANPFFDFF
ncbi:MAG TPA: hypothetical protein VKW78_12360 [Terriglobales bacterium]|jgi:hypothetical protein|nr:hypothetical protein [Terriglobales bacterium]HZP31806.1 hypothetical protein [Candidatus Acidoferrales bacterium]